VHLPLVHQAAAILFGGSGIDVQIFLVGYIFLKIHKIQNKKNRKWPA
jgi:hypothetical protein